MKNSFHIHAMETIASNSKCKVIEEQADVLTLFCNNAHDGDGFLPLSRVQFKLIRGLMVGVGFYVTLTSK